MKNSTINLIHESITNLKREGIAHLVTEDQSYDGRIITLNGQPQINFGLCSYLGLEIDQRLKDAAIDAINRYGIHYSCSRAYVSTTPFTELESLITKIFDAPIVLSTSLSLGHHAVMPVVVDDEDAVIMDQQVHTSVQDAALKLKGRGVTVTIVRHNDLEELKRKTEELSATHKKVWYMIDGVYSMYGDFAPIQAIVDLMNTYKKLHLYADDAHGMGWIGEKGKGYILSQVPLHPKMVLATSLNKAFGAGGGVFIFPDKELCQKVRNCGAAFIFSAPHAMPVLGAAIASAKIFLSEEIYELQMALAEKVKYCQTLLEKNNLPVISNPETPIFFVGVGLVRVGYNLVRRIFNDGCYVNICTFPAVPEACTGIRFTITLHHTMKDIEKLVESIARNYPIALKEEGRNLNDVYRAFRRVADFKVKLSHLVLPEEVSNNGNNNYSVQHETTIHNIDRKLWDSVMADKGTFDWEGLKLLEEAFKDNHEPENNWDFHYYIIKDQFNKPVLATFFTLAICKDDMLAPAKVSRSIEKTRIKNKHYLTSLTFMMGSLITEGQHLYIDRSQPDWKKILMMMLDSAWKDQERLNATKLFIRDFEASDTDLYDFFISQGFIKISFPETHIVDNSPWENKETYLSQLKSDKRYYINRKAVSCEKFYEVNIINNPSDKQIDHFYSLYKNVAKKNFEVTGFLMPKKLFREMAKTNNWEFIELRLKPEYDSRIERPAVGVAMNYKNKGNYCFLLTGMDYNFLEEYNLYPQILWQITSRANQLGLKQTFLGFTASQTKRKFGAKPVEKVAFIQMKDSFNMQLIEIMAKETV
ncbi:MAG: aminotransferase class I/II-fold pyridoxal phosphate-dependent enzyme [Cytophagaceae bacterium]|nr:aminotransferase class I/II-fold pyridoxal phosphate-dependent enzyme [Cytophagaceae bacterium]